MFTVESICWQRVPWLCVVLNLSKNSCYVFKGSIAISSQIKTSFISKSTRTSCSAVERCCRVGLSMWRYSAWRPGTATPAPLSLIGPIKYTGVRVIGNNAVLPGSPSPLFRTELHVRHLHASALIKLYKMLRVKLELLFTPDMSGEIIVLR